MALIFSEAHRALELLEDYHAKLTRPQDKALRLAIERVIRIFKSRLFQALLGCFGSRNKISAKELVFSINFNFDFSSEKLQVIPRLDYSALDSEWRVNLERIFPKHRNPRKPGA
ncbi:hypothetical protein KPH14_003426 [Odynerus spinipes]|uniref:L27 domain-containing protein n=1 Tax=Odynerus spinipes TaxID=1348599 RepID=A0AAD9VKQ6_9HYME|nr:hypothetical protein KPH14_003426 [Odynerus spinipes]